MPVIEWRERARADLLAIIDYIADDNPDAAQRLKDDIETKAAKLLNHPQLYRSGRIAGTREMVVRSNYIVVYAEGSKAVTSVAPAGKGYSTFETGRFSRMPLSPAMLSKTLVVRGLVPRLSH